MKAKKKAFEDFRLNEITLTPGQYVQYVKEEIRKLKFKPDIPVRYYSACHYAINGNYVYTENGKRICTCTNCPHQGKPRCELSKRFKH